ncbi:MAG: ABC transporter ATP-binding protein [Endomicrobia bacterium]|nr:ABC transporter ATP-binding protein [Endomicrobiia bacterium]
MVLLKVEDLYSGYDKKVNILKNINFEVETAEFIGIIGPNAAGKSTLLKTIARLLPINKGHILFDGKDIRKYKYKEYARNIAFSTNLTSYSLNMKVKDFLFLARYPWDFAPYDFDKLYEEFELKNILNKMLKELSSGELQRVIISQTIAQTPKLALFDEPVSHLDIGHQISILDNLKKFNQYYKLTIISSFHELNLACEYCDRLILISCGEIKKIGTPQEVFDYKIIEEVYNTTVVVKTNPISNKPYIIPVPTMWKKE